MGCAAQPEPDTHLLLWPLPHKLLLLRRSSKSLSQPAAPATPREHGCFVHSCTHANFSLVRPGLSEELQQDVVQHGPSGSAPIQGAWQMLLPELQPVLLLPLDPCCPQCHFKRQLISNCRSCQRVFAFLSSTSPSCPCFHSAAALPGKGRSFQDAHTKQH